MVKAQQWVYALAKGSHIYMVISPHPLEFRLAVFYGGGRGIPIKKLFKNEKC